MKVFIASDHGGYWLKESLKEVLRSWGHEVEDLGDSEFKPGDDYPDFVLPMAQKVVETYMSMGIAIGKFGNGEAIVANKVKGVRAALCLSEEMAKMARCDNDANILVLAAKLTNDATAEKILAVFLDTPFPEEERHVRRVKKISSYDASRD
jgi:ribose 5-phosphate isomerase B